MSISEKLEHQNLNDRTYVVLKEGLISSTFMPGEVFVIRSLAERYGISTTPVREALQRLVAEHLLVMKPNRSIMVPLVSQAKFIELYRIRCELEGLAGELATQHFRPADFVRLDKTLDAIDQAIAKQDQTSYRRLNQSFHFMIYQKANSPHLLEMIESLWGRVGPIFNGLFDDPKYDEHANLHHREIAKALKVRDATDVRIKLAQDITSAADSLLPRLQAVAAQDEPGFGEPLRLP